MASLRQLSILLAVLGSGWFLGCASRPEEAIREAQQAMDEARAVQASNFAPGDWKSAQDAWDAAQAALAKQSYGQASNHLMQAKSRFEKARNIARAKRDDVKKEVGTLQSAVNKRFSAAKDLFASGKIKGKSLKIVEGAYQETEKSVEKLNSDMLNDRLVPAKAEAEAALKKLDDLQKKMSAIDRKFVF